MPSKPRRTRGEGRKDVRHEISFQPVKRDGLVYTQTLCSCGKLNAPAFWARERAEAAGEDHILGRANNGRKGA